ncbi:DNA polymerase III subunit epsilon [Pseudothermotoga lettingae TMO]|nr:DNA polymerase III subunit epsilon [Pseudothermotoga lettingae TMO]
MTVMILNESLFCAMDTETTGIDPMNGDRIVEVAIVPVYKGRILYRSIYHTLVNPKIRIPATIEKIHRITNEDIENAPTIEQVFGQMRSFMRRSIMIFHRAEFDLTFIDISAKEIGIFPPSIDYIDTREISEIIFGEKKALSWLAERFGFEKPNHRALTDAITTAKLFLKMTRKLAGSQIEELVHTWRGQEW